MAHAPSSVQRLKQVRKEWPEAAVLAEPLALAVRIEPELLREVRLALVPASHASLEADLYFSPLISQRTPEWLSVDPLLAHELQKRLAAGMRRGGKDEERVRRVRAMVERAHSTVPFEIVREEQIIWMSVEQTGGMAKARQAVNEVLQDLLIRMLQGGDASVALARWFAGAAKRMTPLARQTENFTLLLFAAGSILGGRKIEEINVTLDMFDALTQYPVQSIKRVTFWGALTTHGLHLRPKRHAGYRQVETPLTNPILLEARPENGKRILVQVSPGQTAFVPLAAGVVALRTLARDLLTFRPRADAARAKDVRVARPAESVDILILHGLNLDLATYLKQLFESLGISAASLLELSSLSLSQDAKRDHYIKNCRLSLVVVSFDEEEPGSKKARPNVYDDIMRCRQLKKEDVILLQEFRDGEPVALPSNVVRQMVAIPFDQTALHEFIPPLVFELRSRNLLDITTSRKRPFEAGDIMASFLDQMNDAWDHEFDQAWESIHTSDYEAERAFSEILDKFFQQYVAVFTALVREKVRGDTLRDRCTTALTHSKILAAEAWRIVAKAKLKNAQEESKRLPKTVTGSARALLDQADSVLRKGTRQDAPLEEMYEGI